MMIIARVGYVVREMKQLITYANATNRHKRSTTVDGKGDPLVFVQEIKI